MIYFLENEEEKYPSRNSGIIKFLPFFAIVEDLIDLFARDRLLCCVDYASLSPLTHNTKYRDAHTNVSTNIAEAESVFHKADGIFLGKMKDFALEFSVAK